MNACWTTLGTTTIFFNIAEALKYCWRWGFGGLGKASWRRWHLRWALKEG